MKFVECSTLFQVIMRAGFILSVGDNTNRCGGTLILSQQSLIIAFRLVGIRWISRHFLWVYDQLL